MIGVGHWVAAHFVAASCFFLEFLCVNLSTWMYAAACPRSVNDLNLHCTTANRTRSARRLCAVALCVCVLSVCLCFILQCCRTLALILFGLNCLFAGEYSRFACKIYYVCSYIHVSAHGNSLEVVPEFLLARSMSALLPAPLSLSLSVVAKQAPSAVNNTKNNNKVRQIARSCSVSVQRDT